MGTISPQQVNPNDAVVPGLWNTPINTIANEINGNLDDNNIKSGAAIDPTKIAGGTTGMFGSWAAWTPSWTNLTVGSGTVSAKYKQVGKLIICRLVFTMGSGSSMGTGPTFTLPVTANADYASSTETVGTGMAEDVGVGGYPGIVQILTANTARVQVLNVGGTYALDTAILATVPFTWGSGDKYHAHFCYEAA